MYALVMKIRALVSRYPGLAIWLAGIIARIPRLRNWLGRRYNIMLPPPRVKGEDPPGYRLPLASQAIGLDACGRDILHALESAQADQLRT